MLGDNALQHILGMHSSTAIQLKMMPLPMISGYAMYGATPPSIWKPIIWETCQRVDHFAEAAGSDFSGAGSGV